MDDKDDDIFHMLLRENGKGGKIKNIREGEEQQHVDDEDEDTPFDLHISVDRDISQDHLVKSESELLTFEFIHSHGWSVLDHCVDNHFLYVLVDGKDELAAVHIYQLENDKKQKPQTMVAMLSTSHRSFLFKDTKGSGMRHLYIVHQDSPTTTRRSPSLSVSNDFMKLSNIYLPSLSFASIFGKTTALTKSCVILLCAEDGCVFWGQFNLMAQERENASFLMLFQLHSVVNSVLCVSVCCKRSSGIDADVTEALQKALFNDHSQPETGGDMKGLLAVCDVGECVLILPRMKLRPGCEWIPVRFNLLHPVRCCVAKGNQLFYSTGSSVEVATLIVKDDGGQPSVCLESCKTIQTANIRRLLFQFHSVEDGSEPQLMGLSNDMDLIHIPKASLPSHSSVSMTQNIPDTLKNIDQHYTSTQALQEKSIVLDDFLSQLNMFASLSQRHQQTSSEDQNSLPLPPTLVHCECYCDHSLGYTRDCKIGIKLKNDTTMNLSDRWTVLVRTEQSSPLELKKCFVDVFSFKIEKDLRPGCLKNVFVPVPECMTSDPSTKLKVRISMVLSTPQNFDTDQFDVTVTYQKECTLLEVEIHSQFFDCLHFLTISNSEDLKTSFNLHNVEVIKTCLERLGQKRRKKRENKIIDDLPGKQMIIMKLHHPNYFDNKSMMEIKEKIMQALFQDVHGFPAGEDKGLLVLCRTLSGTEISFIVESSPDNEKTPHLQMKLESRDSVLLSAAHIALLERMKRYCLKKGEFSGSSMDHQVQLQ